MQQWSTQGLVRIVGSTLLQGYGWSQKEAGRGQGWAFVEGFGNAPEEIIWVDHVDPKTSLESVYLTYIKHRNPPSWAAQDFSSAKTKNVCLPKWWISANLFIWVKIVWSLDSQQLCHNGIASFGHTNTHMITHVPFWYLLDPNINLFKKNQSNLGITRTFFWRRAQGESHHHSHCQAVTLSIKAAHDALRMDAGCDEGKPAASTS